MDTKSEARIVASLNGDYRLEWTCPVCLAPQYKNFESSDKRLTVFQIQVVPDGRCDWCKKKPLPKYLQFFKDAFKGVMSV